VTRVENKAIPYTPDRRAPVGKQSGSRKIITKPRSAGGIKTEDLKQMKSHHKEHPGSIYCIPLFSAVLARPVGGMFGKKSGRRHVCWPRANFRTGVPMASTALGGRLQ